MTEVKDGATTDIPAIADALVRAFHDDPVMLHLFPKDKGREKKLRALFVSESKRSLTRGALHTTAVGPAQGAAIWMAPILEKCDAEGVPAYLESSKESNIPFYGRHGFEVRGEVKVKNGPTLWPMWRDPRPPES